MMIGHPMNIRGTFDYIMSALRSKQTTDVVQGIGAKAEEVSSSMKRIEARNDVLLTLIRSIQEDDDERRHRKSQ